MIFLDFKDVEEEIDVKLNLAAIKTYWVLHENTAQAEVIAETMDGKVYTYDGDIKLFEGYLSKN